MSISASSKAIRAGAVTAALALVVAACSSSGKSNSNASSGSTATTAAAAGTPILGGSLTFGLEAESPGYVPGISAMLAYSGGDVERAIYDPLTVYGPDGSGTPFLAQSVTPNADFTQWTVTLRPNVTFASGAPLTAQSIADDYSQYYSAKGSAAAGTFAEVKSVTATGPTTAVFNLVAPDAQFPVLLVTFYPFNPAIRTQFGADFGSHPDGTGPFEFVSWQRDNQITLKANPNYWGKDAAGRKLPYLSTLTLKIIVSGATRNATLQSGGINGYQTVEAPILSQAQSIPGVKVLLGDTGGYGWFINTTKAPVNDIRIRQALAYATDRNAIIASQGAGNIISPRNQYYGPQSPYFSKAAADAFPNVDPTKAKAALTAYVNDPKRSDGKAPGAPVAVQLNYLAGDPSSGAAVQLAKAEWGAIGVQVSLNALDEATDVGAALKGSDQVFWFGWGANVPYGLFHHNYTAPSVNPTNWTKLDDPVVENAITALAQCTSLSCTQQGSATIAQEFDQQLPVIFLMNTDQGWAIDTNKVGGAALAPAADAGLDPTIQWAYLWAKK
jgi:peptide/nickel transport system substrate-binding protein